MTGMPKIQSIRQRRRNGESVASIARGEKVSEPTVRKYLKADDLSARPPVRRRRGSVLDEWIPVIEGMLAEDRETWHKQRHTAPHRGRSTRGMLFCFNVCSTGSAVFFRSVG